MLVFFFDETWKSKNICFDIPVFYKNFRSWYSVIFKKLLQLFSGYFFKNFVVVGIILHGFTHP